MYNIKNTFVYFFASVQTFHREYLTLPTPKSQGKSTAEYSRQQQTLKVPLGGQSSNKKTLMVNGVAIMK